MDFIKQNRTYILLGVLLALSLYAAYVFLGGSAPLEPPLSSERVTSPVESELLGTLRRLKSLTLDPAVFADPVFRDLKDFGIPIPEESVGRPNPFAPLGDNRAQ